MSCDIIDDIEDILKQEKNDLNNESLDGLNRAANKSFILPKMIKKNKNLFSNKFDQNDQINVDLRAASQSETNIPGVASIYVKTWGCTHNSSDSEYMTGQLAAYGYKIIGKLVLKDKN